jgi:hypothetical protein
MFVLVCGCMPSVCICTPCTCLCAVSYFLVPSRTGKCCWKYAIYDEADLSIFVHAILFRLSELAFCQQYMLCILSIKTTGRSVFVRWGVVVFERRYSRDICLEGITKLRDTSARTDGMLGRIEAWELPDTKRGFVHIPFGPLSNLQEQRCSFLYHFRCLSMSV